MAIADMDRSTQERPGGQNYARRSNFFIRCPDADNTALLDLESFDLRNDQLKIFGGRDNLPHTCLVKVSIRLRPRPADSRSLRSVEKPELDAGLIGSDTHRSPEGVDLSNKMPLSEATDRGIARHYADIVGFHGDQSGPASQACRRERGFASRMATADDKYVELFHVKHLLSDAEARKDLA